MSDTSLQGVDNASLLAHSCALFAHDRWANDRALEVLAGLSPTCAEALERMAHVVACLELWLSRWEGRGNPPTPLIWPRWELEEIRRRNGAAHDAWAKTLSSLDPAALEETIRCEPMTGPPRPYAVKRKHVLVQLPLHGAYHRGQVSTLIRGAGAGPLNVDYIMQHAQLLDADG